MVTNDRVYGQFAEPCRAPSPQAFRGEAPSPTAGIIELVPSLCVSERYDSNVFFRPATEGLDREDYVTSANPSLRLNHSGDYATGFLDVEGISETYFNNSRLNFLGSNGTLSLNLDNTIKRILPKASLFVTDAVRYAPLPPGFVNPAAGTAPGDPTNVQDIFSQGILFARTNRVSNIGTVSTSYATSASTKVTAAYSHATLRFLSDSVNLFDTTTQTATAGGIAQVSEVDQLNIKYSFAQSDFVGGSVGSFLLRTHTTTAGWSRTLTPNITAEAGGGGIVIDTGRTTYAANAALMMNFATAQITLSYSRSAFPGFVGVPTVVIGDVVSLAASHQLSSRWQLSGNANYSHSSGTGQTNSIKFDTYGASANLAYFITRIWSVGLSYTYLRFQQERGTTMFEFDRHVGMFSVRATWG